MTRPETILENERLAVAAYVSGRIEADSLERALEHVHAGGMGCAEYPFLPVFEAFRTETVER